MTRRSKPKTTTTTTPIIPFPVDTPLIDKQPAPPPPLNEQEEEHQHYIKMCEAMDNPFNEPGDSLFVVEYSLADEIEEQKLSREEYVQSQSTPLNTSKEIVIQTSPAGTNLPTTGVITPPVTAAAADSNLPKITRHKGQRVQTVKTIYTQVPIQYRAALDRVKEKTRRSVKEVICEAIGLVAVKHGITKEAGNIRDWPDWD